MADIFDVIADSTRRDILRLLLTRAEAGVSGTNVSEIVAELGMSQPTISKHLKVLRENDLVFVREEGQHRYYSVDAQPLREVDDWLFPFLVADDADLDDVLEEAALPEQAIKVAESVGRAAASAKNAVQSALRRFGPS